MKKLLSILTLGLLLVACGENNSTGYTINGSLKGDIADGTQIFLKTSTDGRTLIEVDTTTTTDGKFTFKGDVPTTLDPHYVFTDNIRNYNTVYLEKGTINVTAHKDSLFAAKNTGTKQNDMRTEFFKGTYALDEKRKSINKDIHRAQQERDTAMLKALKEEVVEINAEAVSHDINFLKNNPDALISIMVINKLFTTKAINLDETLQYMNGLSDEVKQIGMFKALDAALKPLKATAIGSKAPEFSAPTPDGKTMALSEALGKKITILDFWAAWCKPCRNENPNIVNIYNKYHDKGLNVFGVSFDRNADDWKKAIEDDGLTWNHVSNVQYFDEIAKLYNLNAIPASFILDENGVILAKNLRGKQLEDKIAELMQ